MSRHINEIDEDLRDLKEEIQGMPASQPEVERTYQAVQALKGTTKDLAAEIVDYWHNSTGTPKSIQHIQQYRFRRTEALAWAMKQAQEGMETPAAVAWRRYMRADRALVALCARLRDQEGRL